MYIYIFSYSYNDISDIVLCNNIVPGCCLVSAIKSDILAMVFVYVKILIMV